MGTPAACACTQQHSSCGLLACATHHCYSQGRPGLCHPGLGLALVPYADQTPSAHRTPPEL